MDNDWAVEVAQMCAPVFEAADVGFKRQVTYADEDRRVVAALVWEADPRQFAARYPNSGIVETYGEDQLATK